jgi:4-diphosphocytidyl-2-C-methyl-D-erythritol kinase
MEERAYAKLNLALHVRAREADGYHRIETLFAFAEAGDWLRVAEHSSLMLHLEGPFAAALTADEDNMVLRAAAALRTRYRIDRGAALTLEKILPVGAGLGGGSADAAAALRLLSRFWAIPVEQNELFDLARMLGADVPACLVSRPARGEGRGDLLSAVEDWVFAGAPVLMANPGRALATADVFRAWQERDRGPLADPLEGRNDLEEPARQLCPEIGDVVEALRDTAGTRLVRMSGSGATCFALYESDQARDAAHSRISQSHPHWWLLASRLRS